MLNVPNEKSRRCIVSSISIDAKIGYVEPYTLIIYEVWDERGKTYRYARVGELLEVYPTVYEELPEQDDPKGTPTGVKMRGKPYNI